MIKTTSSASLNSPLGASSFRSRRFLLLVTGCCFALGCSQPSTVQAQLKVGVVDMNRIFNGYYKTEESAKKMRDAQESAKKELDERMESHKQMMDEINTLNKNLDHPALSDVAKKEQNRRRDDKIAQVRALEQEIQEFKAQRERGLQEQAVRMRNQIVEEIMTIINARVKSDAYDLVFDKSGQSSSGVPVVLHSNDKFEFSDDVVSQLNKSRPAATVSASPTPTGTPAATGSPRPTATPRR